MSHPWYTKAPVVQWGFPHGNDSEPHSCTCKAAPAGLLSPHLPLLQARHTPQLEEIEAVLAQLKKKKKQQEGKLKAACNKWRYGSSPHLHSQEHVHPSLHSCSVWLPVPQDGAWWRDEMQSHIFSDGEWCKSVKNAGKRHSTGDS